MCPTFDPFRLLPNAAAPQEALSGVDDTPTVDFYATITGIKDVFRLRGLATGLRHKVAGHLPVTGSREFSGGDSRTPARYKLSGLDVQANAFPYSASKRLHAFSARGSLY